MDLTRDAILELKETGIEPKDRIVTVDNNRQFVIDRSGEATEIVPRVYHAKEAMTINTLSGFVNYVKSQLDRKDDKLIVQIKNEKSVFLKGLLDVEGSREVLAHAAAIVPRFEYEFYYEMEEFNIALQSKFVNLMTGELDKGQKLIPDDRSLLLQVVGNVAEKNVKQASDDGVSQAITINQGVATQANVQLPNPVLLAPYRTFLEVDQPTSQFVFRMKDGPRAAIFEADGGAWRNQAIVNIREYLHDELKNEIESGKITLIA